MLGLIDFAPIECDPSAIFLSIVNQFEGIVGRARTPTQNAHNHVGIVLNQLLHRPGSMIGYFEENRTPGIGHTCKTAQNMIVDELTHFFRSDPGWHIGIEDFKKISKSLGLCFLTKGLEGFQGVFIPVQIVHEGHRVEAQVGPRKHIHRAVTLDLTTLNVIDAR